MKKYFFVVLGLLSACQSIPQSQQTSDAEESSINSQVIDESKKTPADWNTELGAGYIGNGQYDRALYKLNKAIKQDSKHALAHNYLGVLYGKLKESELAYKYFNKSVRLAPYDSTILNNYAIFLCEQKKYDEAQAKFKKVIANPLYLKRFAAFQSAGWCAYQNNNLELAEQMYRKALELEPFLPRSMLGMAKVLYKKGEYEFAWKYFERFDNASAPDADSLWLGINILRQMSYPDKNLLSSYEMQLKSKYPDSDQARWYFKDKQDY